MGTSAFSDIESLYFDRGTMKLEKIVINGFKSFADKTELQFGCPITAIVGPNGCGKSNVVDAIKWVLGSQSPKSLRSDQMADVIFSGCSSRKPSGMAEVTLYFTDVRGLGIEQDSLEISRRLYRDGESEYIINNKASRLKDIRELFMDTGIGVSAYSIIEQGQIDQLLAASTVDRRVIFEEAAGVSRFKAHKKEALRKLERTEQNLLRLADIVSEVQKQLRSVKLQAGKARSYVEYTGRLKELRVNFSLAEYHKIKTGIDEKKTSLGKWQERFADVAARAARHDAASGELTANILDAESQINRWDSAFIAARSKIEQQLERIDFLKVRIEENKTRQAAAAEQIKNGNGQIQQLSGEMDRCRADLEKNRQDLAGQDEQISAVERDISRINKLCASVSAELEDEKSGIIDIVRRTAQLHNEIQSLSNYRDSLAGQKTRLSGRAGQTQAQLTEWLTEKAQCHAKLADIQSVLSGLQTHLETKRTLMQEVDSKRCRAMNELTAAREQRSALTGELNVLQDMEARREGLSETLKSILDNRDNSRGFIEGIIADVLTAEPAYSVSIEAALEGRTDTLLVNSTSTLLGDARLIAQNDNRLHILCIDRLEPFVDTAELLEVPGVLGRLIEFVRFESRFAGLAWQLLGKCLLVDSLPRAIELSGRLGSGYRCVTRDGQAASGGCVISTGPIGKSAQLISRKSRIVQLADIIAQQQQNISVLEQSLAEADCQNEHLAGLCKDMRTSIYEANTEKIDAESRLRMLEQNIKRLTDEQPVIAGEIRMLEEEIGLSVQKEHDSRQKLEELEQINSQRNAHIETLQGSLNENTRELQSRGEHLTELKIQLGRSREQQKALDQRISSLSVQIQQSRTSVENARCQTIACCQQIEQTERQILSAESAVSQLYLEKEQAQKQSRQLHRLQEELSVRQKENALALRQVREEQARVEEQTHQIQLELSQLGVRDEDLCQRVREELGIELSSAYEAYQQQDTDWEAVRNEIADLRAKIERLGNVNLDALEQQQELERRFEFLSSQVEDLNKSRDQIQQLIERINSESREKFQVTFEQVRLNFQEIFRKLFGGGRADIFLENPEDLLESGIEIVARPPGKETRTISLLSGGEKTMTAIALLFAVFKSKPSPFCILDEVDAALDEANNERFNVILRQFQQQSQFIVITHSKRTMSMADMLYGITMQTQGISKKISVQFGDTETGAAVA